VKILKISLSKPISALVITHCDC